MLLFLWSKFYLEKKLARNCHFRRQWFIIAFKFKFRQLRASFQNSAHLLQWPTSHHCSWLLFFTPQRTEVTLVNVYILSYVYDYWKIIYTRRAVINFHHCIFFFKFTAIVKKFGVLLKWFKFVFLVIFPTHCYGARIFTYFLPNEA